MKSLVNFLEDLILNPEPNGFCMLKPGFAKYEDSFETILESEGWKILDKCEKTFTMDEIEKFYEMHKYKPFFNNLCNYMISDKCICYSCHKHTNHPIEDMDRLKEKIRNDWGKDDMKNAMHSSDSKENVNREIELAFNNINS